MSLINESFENVISILKNYSVNVCYMSSNRDNKKYYIYQVYIITNINNKNIMFLYEKGTLRSQPNKLISYDCDGFYEEYERSSNINIIYSNLTGN